VSRAQSTEASSAQSTDAGSAQSTDASSAQSTEASSAQSTGSSNWLVRRLTRVTSGGRYIPALDGLRWLAMALVFLQHFQLAIVATTVDRSVSPDPGLRTLYDLRVGVELFFVISGFILGVPFVQERVLGEERVDLRAYFLRRLTRIEPPYAIALAIFTAAWLLVGRDPAITLRHALASLFYVHNLVYGAFHPQAINMVTWSLEIEVQFYLLAPLLARVFLVKRARTRRVALVSSIVLSAVLVELARNAGHEPPLSILTQIPYFAAGFLLADLYVVDWKTEPSTSWRWDLVAIPAWCALPFVATAPIPMKDLAIAAALFIAFVASFRSVGTRAFLGWTPVRLLGGMCYSIYLFHYLLVMFGWRYVFAADLFGASHAHGAYWIDTLGYGALVFALLFPVFLAYYLLVEHPFMSNRWWKRLMPHPPR
jgi:peptidoglycan/LPS O-acetylase OafA/YrhL